MDYVVLELQRRGLKYYRLNTESLPQYRVEMGIHSRDDWKIYDGENILSGGDVRAAYFRRPGKPEVKQDLEERGHLNYAESEWASFLKSLYSRLDKMWLNSPANILLSEDKPRQLFLAKDIGFLIPETSITNDINSFKSIAALRSVIGKPLRQALIEDKNEKIIFTTSLPALDSVDEIDLSFAPIIVQHEIKKAYDIRIIVVGSKVFPVAIHSQDNTVTVVDWRRGEVPDLLHEPIILPVSIEQKCKDIVRKLGLKFGAIDMVKDLDDRYWFLEINPNGQWAWIENRTGLPIASAIVDELVGELS
ncbi:hypothetical protein BJB45_08325 [Halomonas huangheensis]|uniref:ATP-grasp domain-containing protein n=2 Tax=Halomonas huangheensis TaxID=1178482 RepID=W1NAJ7_9GAMM|nr:hypothetical protein [Halomonas huangheensis]ERL52549.1 hypothetical protein BJB45_08325 [Halomonas huangheensis]